jgi:hypothetical protein
MIFDSVVVITNALGNCFGCDCGKCFVCACGCACGCECDSDWFKVEVWVVTVVSTEVIASIVVVASAEIMARV